VALNSVNRLLQVVERARAVSHKLRNHEKIERVDSGEHSLLLLVSSAVLCVEAMQRSMTPWHGPTVPQMLPVTICTKLPQSHKAILCDA
jgi:hypothetical protein